MNRTTKNVLAVGIIVAALIMFSLISGYHMDVKSIKLLVVLAGLAVISGYFCNAVNKRYGTKWAWICCVIDAFAILGVLHFVSKVI